MKTFPFSFVDNSLVDANLADDCIRTNYSGRGMYGTECFGIVGTVGELVLFGGVIADYAHTYYKDMVDMVYLLLSEAVFDNMGLDMIMYFPGWTLDMEA